MVYTYLYFLGLSYTEILQKHYQRDFTKRSHIFLYESGFRITDQKRRYSTIAGRKFLNL